MASDPSEKYVTQPHTFTDEQGRNVVVDVYGDEGLEPLVSMHATLAPSQRKLGCPPFGEPAVRNWLETTRGQSLVATHHGRIVGHLLFADDGAGGHDLGVFLKQDYASRRLKSALVRTALGFARERGLSDLSVTLGPSEIPDQGLYTGVGFELADANRVLGMRSLSCSP